MTSLKEMSAIAIEMRVKTVELLSRIQSIESDLVGGAFKEGPQTDKPQAPGALGAMVAVQQDMDEVLNSCHASVTRIWDAIHGPNSVVGISGASIGGSYDSRNTR